MTVGIVIPDSPHSWRPFSDILRHSVYAADKLSVFGEHKYAQDRFPPSKSAVTNPHDLGGRAPLEMFGGQLVVFRRPCQETPDLFCTACSLQNVT